MNEQLKREKNLIYLSIITSCFILRVVPHVIGIGVDTTISADCTILIVMARNDGGLFYLSSKMEYSAANTFPILIITFLAIILPLLFVRCSKCKERKTKSHLVNVSSR